MDTIYALSATPYIPFGSGTTVPKDDPRWAKMYCVFMFDRQMLPEYRYKRFIGAPTSSPMKKGPANP